MACEVQWRAALEARWMSIFARPVVLLAFVLLGCSSSGSNTALGGAGGAAGAAGVPGSGGASSGGTAGGETGGNPASGGQAGAPNPCTLDADCPAASNECQASRCTAGQCKIAFVPS